MDKYSKIIEKAQKIVLTSIYYGAVPLILILGLLK